MKYTVGTVVVNKFIRMWFMQVLRTNMFLFVDTDTAMRRFGAFSILAPCICPSGLGISILNFFSCSMSAFCLLKFEGVIVLCI